MSGYREHIERCSVDDCARPYHAKGYCAPHYWRLRRTGRIQTTRPGIAFHVDKLMRETDDCILWDGRTTDRGYGKYGDVYVHRYAYETFVGPIPEGLTIDHLCRNKLCCNPRHLEPVTREENHRRWVETLPDECHRGHPYTPENTYLKQGRRNCRTCKRLYRSDRRRPSEAA